MQTGHRESRRNTLGCVSAVALLVSCGGNLDNRLRIESRGYEIDSGASSHCTEQPWAITFDFAIDANGVVSHASTDFLPADRVRLTQSVSTVAQGALGSEGLLAASLSSVDGSILSQELFDDPRFVNARGTAERGNGYGLLSIQLVPGANRLVITNWQTGATLLDLDIHGDIQLQCLNQPCLNLCANFDGGLSPVLDGGVDLSAAVADGGAE